MRRSLILCVGLVAASLGATAAGAAPPPAAADAAAEHRRIVAYWTPERRAAAVPRDLVLTPNGKPAKPGGGGGTGVVTGATWTGGGSVTVTTGKVFFTLGASRYTCSASAVDSPAGNLVLTAGHCVHDGDGGAFATNWIFYPGWNGAPSPTLGEWTASDLFTTAGWATGSTSFDDDAGFAVVVGAEGQGTLASVLVAAGGAVPGITFTTTTDPYSAFGYPASKKYRGDTLTYCAGPVTPGVDGHQTLALACDMTGGSSGGPWFQKFSNGATSPNTINSLNSYGYLSVRNTMFGPIFDGAESTTYTAASALGNCLAPIGLGYHCVSHS